MSLLADRLGSGGQGRHRGAWFDLKNGVRTASTKANRLKRYWTQIHVKLVKPGQGKISVPEMGRNGKDRTKGLCSTPTI